MQLRFGIIGCGLIGAKRAGAIRALGHQVAWVKDPQTERAQALAALAQATVVEQILPNTCDVVIVATTHQHLASEGLKALEAGCHVLLEKPAARCLTELEPLRALAQQKNLHVKVGFNHRFHPAMQQAKALLDTGIIGDVLFVRGRYGHGGRPGYEQEWRCQKHLSGGGELIDQGSHLIDLTRWFMGDVSVAYAHLPTYFWGNSLTENGVEDNCFLALKGPQPQQLAWLHASWTEWKNQFSFEMMGRVGKLEITGLGGSYGLETLVMHVMRPEMGPPDTTRWEYPPDANQPDLSWQLELAEFCAQLTGQPATKHGATLADAMANLQLVQAAYSLG